jgi:hypothetical protein
MDPQTAAPLEERNWRLWIVAAAPAVWAAHFMMAYCTAAIWCAKWAGESGSLAPARVAIAIYTAVSLAGIAIIGRRGWRDYRLVDLERDEQAQPQPEDEGEDRHSADSPTARHGFLGFATLLLSGLSAVAIVYGGLPVIFLESCR